MTVLKKKIGLSIFSFFIHICVCLCVFGEDANILAAETTVSSKQQEESRQPETRTRNQPSHDGVRIGIIDTGIASAALPEAVQDAGHNYIFPDASTEDLVGHGTEVAGILAGSEQAGLTGVCPSATLIPLVYYTLDENGEECKGDAALVAEILRDAVDIYHCDIVQISSVTATDDDTLRKAVAYAEEQGVLVVAAAGDRERDDDTYFYPASYETVLSVAATAQEEITVAANPDPAGADLIAPGIWVQTVSAKGKLVLVKGSSFAASYVTGRVAELLEENREYTPAQIRSLLCEGTPTSPSAEKPLESSSDADDVLWQESQQETPTVRPPAVVSQSEDEAAQEGTQEREEEQSKPDSQMAMAIVILVILALMAGVSFAVWKHRIHNHKKENK